MISLLASCGLANKVIQPPLRLMQAGVRTVTEVDDTTTPATRDSQQLHGLAVKVSERIGD